MNNLQENISLKQFTTFGIETKAKHFATFKSVEELIAILKTANTEDLLILGGGSNMLFTKDYEGLVLKNEIMGIDQISEDDQHIFVKFGAGEVWHNSVLACIDNGWAGVENLSLIPGTMGAAPLQNIGAYGVELKDVFQELEALHIQERKIHCFNNFECQFGYRESIFKKEEKGNYIITSVTLKLNKNPELNTSYGAIERELEVMGIKELSIKAISDAVIRIRESKLPNPDEIGNAGSFFKNPVISANQYEQLKIKHPNISSYPLDDGTVKIAAGWLIDQAGWKGKTYDNYGVHKNQALVLVNYGDAQGRDIFKLSENIISDIKSKFGIQLEREVNVY